MGIKHISDIRASSADSRYVDGGFVGTMDDALRQARAAKEYPLPNQPGRIYVNGKCIGHQPGAISRDRYNVLKFLRLI